MVANCICSVSHLLSIQHSQCVRKGTGACPKMERRGPRLKKCTPIEDLKENRYCTWPSGCRDHGQAKKKELCVLYKKICLCWCIFCFNVCLPFFFFLLNFCKPESSMVPSWSHRAPGPCPPCALQAVLPLHSVYPELCRAWWNQDTAVSAQLKSLSTSFPSCGGFKFRRHPNRATETYECKNSFSKTHFQKGC